MHTKSGLSFLVLTLISYKLVHCLDENVIAVFQLTKDLINEVDVVWKKVGQFSSDRDILRQMKKIEQKIHNMEDYVCNI